MWSSVIIKSGVCYLWYTLTNNVVRSVVDRLKITFLSKQNFDLIIQSPLLVPFVEMKKVRGGPKFIKQL